MIGMEGGRLLRELQNLFCGESEATGAPTPETTGTGRVRGKRPPIMEINGLYVNQ
ncbi:hypothetical protein MHH37_05710 [Solibacillus sp. FSL K6-1781]|uniref:hypothetical protein n=1 Tax=Solibacillus sp. FSL K6-1781 TaxID=2921474 RepID=UPI00315A04B6